MKNLGIILIALGAIMQILSVTLPFMADLADQNWYTWGALGLIIVGLITHIATNKKVD